MPACRPEPSTIWEQRSPWTGFLPIALVLILLGGCATTSQQTLREHLALDALERRCEPPAGVVSRLALPPVRVRPRADADNLAVFSKPSRDFAGAMGLAPLLADLVEEAKTSGAGAAPHVRFLETRQALSDHLLLLSFEAAGVVAELDCEAARAGHLANGLEEAREKRIRTMTLIAIIGDALVGILAGGLSLAMEETAAAAAAISGGAIATTFGLAAVFSGTRHVFQHERNLLRELWEETTPPHFWPPSVWRYLTARQNGAGSRRDALVTHWRSEGFLGTSGQTATPEITLYFGAGGIYEIEALRTRAVMLETVKSEVNRMNQDLNLLMHEIVALSHEHRSTGTAPEG